MAYKWRGVNYRAFDRATDVVTNAVQEVLPNKASFAVPLSAFTISVLEKFRHSTGIS